MIQTRDLVKRFERGTALAGVDVEVAAGEVVSVMGPSGCGKTTLLNLLGGLDRPTSGSIRLAGRDVAALSPGQWARLRRRSIGFVFQELNLVDALSVVQNVELPARLDGVPARAARFRALDLLEQVGLADAVHAAPPELSGGERQRAAIARALVNHPEVLLADEPTGSLDSRRTTEVLALLLAQRRRDLTVVLVTHDPRVATVADRLLSMRDGRIVDETQLSGLESGLTIGSLAQTGDGQ